MNIQQIEQASIASWPALQEQAIDGGLLRYSNGLSRRGNALILAGKSNRDASLLIKDAECFYHGFGEKVIAKVCSTDGLPEKNHSHLDLRLAQKHYRIESPTHVMVKQLDEVVTEPLVTSIKKIEIVDLQRWLVSHCAIKKLSRDDFDTHFAMLEKLAVPSCFLVLKNTAGNTVATGFATQSGDAIGVYGLATDNDYRRQGFGTAIVAALEEWGRQHNGSYAYLQVEAANKAAFGLYQKFGYTSFYHYWYRIEQ